MVLLKNDNNTLPISPAVKNVAVLGASVPFSTTDVPTSTGGTVNFATDVRSGDLGSQPRLLRPGQEQSAPSPASRRRRPAASPSWRRRQRPPVPQNADFIVVVAGLTPQDEGEEYTGAGDRTSFALDGKQTDACDGYQDTQNTLITAGGRAGQADGRRPRGGERHQHALARAGPGRGHGLVPGAWSAATALGSLLFGDGVQLRRQAAGHLGRSGANEPFNGNGGRRPTFDYYVGYRYFDQNGNIAPLFPFGAGLSYTTFKYSNLQLGCSTMSQGAVLPVVVNVTNTGTVAGDETVMVFVSFPNTTARRPRQGAEGLRAREPGRGRGEAGDHPASAVRSRLLPGRLPPTATTGHWVVETGPVTSWCGGSSDQPPAHPAPST